MVPFWEVLERARHGEPKAEKDFDMSIFYAAGALRKESGIKYEPEAPVPPDNAMADELFELGLQLYLEVGTYCVDTGKVIRFTEGEIRRALEEAPSQIYLGEGEDRVVMAHRDIGDGREPVVAGGIQTALYSDPQSMFNIYRACAQDGCIDGIWGGIIDRIEGRYQVMAGAPSEIYAYRKSIEVLRNAAAAAGRPGMFVVNNAPGSAATLGMFDSEGGLRPTDPFLSTGVSEMKIAFSDMDRTAYALACGLNILSAHQSVIGGFSGSVEGAAMVSVAGAFQCLLVNRAAAIRPGNVHIRLKTRMDRQSLWAASIALQALSRNTHLILDGGMGDHPAAGPGTKQYLYEAAAGFIASTACGGHSMGGTRKYVISNVPNYGSPLESRWMGEICKASAGMGTGAANEIVLNLLPKYEDSLKDAPAGETFENLYNVADMEPKGEYQRLYDEVKTELARLGVNFV